MIQSCNNKCICPTGKWVTYVAEKSVQIVKNLLTKAKLDNMDPYLSLLEYHTTNLYDIGLAMHELSTQVFTILHSGAVNL